MGKVLVSWQGHYAKEYREGWLLGFSGDHAFVADHAGEIHSLVYTKLKVVRYAN